MAGRLLAGVTTTALGTVGVLLALDAVRGLGRAPLDVDSAVAALAGLALSGLLLVWCCGAAAAVIASAAGTAHRTGALLQALAEATTPVLLRRVLAAALGAAVLSGASGPALAAGGPVGRSADVAASTSRSASTAPPVGPSLTWPTTRPGPRAAAVVPRPTSPAPSASPAAPSTEPTASPPAAPPSAAPPSPAEPSAAVRIEVVVQRGDTLWSIAARHLPEGSTRAAVAAAWPRWHAANRAVIGADPDHLRPGQRLVAP